MLERLFEIVENKEYEYAEHEERNNGNYLFRDSRIKIYTKDGAYIRIIKDWFIDGGIFRGHRVDRYHISFFVPDQNTAIDSYDVCDDKHEEVYKKMTKLFNDIKQNIKDDAMKKYF